MGVPLERACDKEIAKLCGYIRDDRSIAAYFGCPREQIARVRAGMKRGRYVRQDSGLSRHSDLPLPVNDREPCPRCGVRRDIGCRHSTAPLGMIL